MCGLLSREETDDEDGVGVTITGGRGAAAGAARLQSDARSSSTAARLEPEHAHHARAVRAAVGAAVGCVQPACVV